ncbi:MAG: GNAT family N-acetyltransferase [candidate division NC10 bacterium]|nr:GNAT family N-acetyltransferase [candidate division NC10 bacterium]MDE2322681.1 GNAT family N-acetyltransferase [candidate division NC10 bacterium]
MGGDRIDPGGRLPGRIQLMPGHSEFSVRWFASATQIADDLWETCFPPPLEGQWWYAALENSRIEDQFRFAYMQIERSGEPVGIVPVFVMDVPIDLVAPPKLAGVLKWLGALIRVVRYQRTLFIGSVCADEGWVGLKPGISLAHVAPVIQRATDERARVEQCNMIVWKDFPGPQAVDLESIKTELGLFKLVSFPSTQLRLSGPGFEPYLKNLTGSRRHNLKKKLRRGKERGKLHTTVVQHPDDATLDEIWGLFWQTYEKGKTKFERFNIEFFRQIRRCPQAHFILMRDTDTHALAAFMLCFQLGTRAINKFLGIDYTLDGGNRFLYFQLWEQFVEWASRTGATELQSGQTGYRAKLDVGHDLVPLTNYCKHISPFFHGLFETATRDVTWETLDEDLAVFLKAHGNDSI